MVKKDIYTNIVVSSYQQDSISYEAAKNKLEIYLKNNGYNDSEINDFISKELVRKISLEEMRDYILKLTLDGKTPKYDGLDIPNEYVERIYKMEAEKIMNEMNRNASNNDNFEPVEVVDSNSIALNNESTDFVLVDGVVDDDKVEPAFEETSLVPRFEENLDMQKTQDFVLVDTPVEYKPSNNGEALVPVSNVINHDVKVDDSPIVAREVVRNDVIKMHAEPKDASYRLINNGDGYLVKSTDDMKKILRDSKVDTKVDVNIVSTKKEPVVEVETKKEEKTIIKNDTPVVDEKIPMSEYKRSDRDKLVDRIIEEVKGFDTTMSIKDLIELTSDAKTTTEPIKNEEEKNETKTERPKLDPVVTPASNTKKSNDVTEYFDKAKESAKKGNNDLFDAIELNTDEINDASKDAVDFEKVARNINVPEESTVKKVDASKERIDKLKKGKGKKVKKFLITAGVITGAAMFLAPLDFAAGCIGYALISNAIDKGKFNPKTMVGIGFKNLMLRIMGRSDEIVKKDEGKVK